MPLAPAPAEMAQCRGVSAWASCRGVCGGRGAAVTWQGGECHRILDPRGRARGPGTHRQIDVTAALTQDPHHLQKAPPHGHMQRCAPGAVKGIGPAPGAQERPGSLRLVPGGRGSGRRTADPSAWVDLQAHPPPRPCRGLTPGPRSAAPCCPHRRAGLRPPVPAAAAAPAPPGPGRQPPAGRSCPGSWRPPARRASGSVPGPLSLSLGLAGGGAERQGSRELACSGCLLSRSRAPAILPRATSTTSLPGCSRSLFWARSLSRATLREPGWGRARVKWWPRERPCLPPATQAGCPHFCSPWHALLRPGWHLPQGGRPPGRRG